jgi:P27 family predicted phage terminase small subunit
MGKRGPRAAPVALKKLRGNPGRRPLENVIEPMQMVSLPRQPAWLTGKAKTIWSTLGPELMRYGLLTGLDTWAFAMLCKTWSDWRDAAKLAESVGRTSVSPNGFPQVHANHVVERQLRLDFLHLAEHFGMTPSGRSGLAIHMDEGANKLLSWLSKRKE